MFFQIGLLVCALCLDTFVAALAYGTNRVQISGGQIALLNGICSLVLGLSLLLGAALSSQIPDALARGICFLGLFFLGCLRLIDSAIRRYLQRHRSLHKNASFHFSNLRLIIDIYSDPMEADADGSQSLSYTELFFFSLAMSVDSLLTGITAGLLEISVPLAVLASFLVGELFTYAGLFLGKKISGQLQQGSSRELSWVGGLLLILLAVLKTI